MLSRIDRAKQFLPFDALNGLQDALREKEVEYVDKIELSDDKKQELSDKLRNIKVGEKVRVMFYINNQYKEANGKANDINKLEKYIIVDNIKIYFTDILSIKISTS